MSLIALLLAVLLASTSAAAQEPEASSTATGKSATEDTSATRQDSEGSTSSELPVSLDRIREGLARAPAKPLLQNIDRKPDFRQEIQVQQKIDELLSTLDLKTGPRAPGGLYGYEQQQRLWNSVDHPLMQPYAAFSGGEILTLAIESLAIKYLGGRALSAVTDAQRASAEEAAREEVAHAIAKYCAAQPGGGVGVRLCDTPLSQR